MAAIASSQEHKVYVPTQENFFKWGYKPAGDYFFGPNTEYTEEGRWYDEWVARSYFHKK